MSESDDKKVLRLVTSNSAPIEDKLKPVESIVDYLDHMLTLAKEGKIMGIGAFVVYSDHETDYSMLQGDPCHENDMIAGAARLQSLVQVEYF